MGRLAELSPNQWVERLRGEGIARAYIVFDAASRVYHASHRSLGELAELLANERDCREHEAIFFRVGPQSGCLFAAFLHKTLRGQAQGGLRHWNYASLGEFLRDGLRLSVGMTRKNALAGLWWGGGKGIIARAPGESYRDDDFRRTLYREYGDFVSSLRGTYVAGEDVGTTPSDMADVFCQTRYVTCLPVNRGGAGNPSDMTAAGVICAVEAALEHRGMGSLAGKKIVMQGTGHVGSAMIPRLLARGVSHVLASEISHAQRDALLDAFEGEPVEIRVVPEGDLEILAESCDVLMPNALGGVLGPKTIPNLRAAVVCGSANNPLVDEQRDARALCERGVTYVPDIVANRMGIVACSNEQYGHVNNDPMVQRHFSSDWGGGIHATTRRVLDHATEFARTPVDAALRLADKLAEHPHPIWGHRSRAIIESLIADHWENETR